MPRCRCAHLWAVHAIGTRAGVKVRTACSAADPHPCRCPRYEEAS